MCPDLPLFHYKKQLRFLAAFLIYSHASTFPEGNSLPLWFHSICIKLTLFTLLINSLYNETETGAFNHSGYQVFLLYIPIKLQKFLIKIQNSLHFLGALKPYIFVLSKTEHEFTEHINTLHRFFFSLPGEKNYRK